MCEYCIHRGIESTGILQTEEICKIKKVPLRNLKVQWCKRFSLKKETVATVKPLQKLAFLHYHRERVRERNKAR